LKLKYKKRRKRGPRKSRANAHRKERKDLKNKQKTGEAETHKFLCEYSWIGPKVNRGGSVPNSKVAAGKEGSEPLSAGV